MPMGDFDSKKTLENRSQRATKGMVASHLLQGIIKLVIDVLASCWWLLGRVLSVLRPSCHRSCAMQLHFDFCNYRHTHSSHSSSLLP